MSIGENIREVRLSRRMTQRALADAIGSAPGTIQQYESGKREPKAGLLQKIADALDCPFDYLIQADVDEMMRKVIDIFPNAPVRETDGKISIPLAGVSAGDQPSSEELRQMLLLERYNMLNRQGQTKVIDYASELCYVPEYRKGKQGWDLDRTFKGDTPQGGPSKGDPDDE